MTKSRSRAMKTITDAICRARAVNNRHVICSHAENAVSFQLECYSDTVDVLVSAVVLLGALSSAMVQKFPLTSRLLYVSWHVSGTFSCTWERCCRMISPIQHTAVLRKIVCSQKCVHIYRQESLCSVTLRN